ncbi:DUF1640 domain-containing protein [Desulfovibrio sp. ZJ369]|uniref:DUF1640 domain-containing protein n=1 Tax=Desulfovibrio sp. ZJ369 TaxID=2709793 RepID=UPI0013EC532E|nr:DUF1640 domain-containing protein [Desulfovibrio sp. ZJ369]
MTTTTFDSLDYFEQLKAAGVPEEQAKIQATALRGVIEHSLVTKRDLKELELRLIIRLGGIVVACTALLVAILPIVLR